MTLLVPGVSAVVIAMGNENMTLNKLTPEEEQVIVNKGTEPPFSGEYCKHKTAGTYVCKRCDAALYRSNDKFDSECGWPSFDDEIPGAVKRVADPDGVRTEIICANCDGHLGHVFEGERLTAKDVRHCVNSLSLTFVPAKQDVATETAYFAGGCFWGTESLLGQQPGVLQTEVGYMGGQVDNPIYDDLCSGKTGHTETVKVVFDPSLTIYEKLARYFFEIHDPTQVDRQGPDVGSQYRSVVFFDSNTQKLIAQKLIGILTEKGYTVVTKIEQAGPFWGAEEYHQNYYAKTGKTPYCHFYQKRF